MRIPALFGLIAVSLAACGDESPTQEARQPHLGGIPVVDEAAAKAADEAARQKVRDNEHGPTPVDGWAAAQGQPACAQPTPQAAPAPQPDKFSAPGNPQALMADFQRKAVVIEYMRKLMDETRTVPDTAAKKGGPRGSPGSFAKLSSAQVEEFAAAIIYGAKRYLPQSLKDEERWALVCAEISIESAFQPGTKGVNPGDNSKVSVGPLQLTLPGMWDDLFRQYASGDGLVHYDGSPWNPKDTKNEALENSIYDGIVAALWCITEQGRRGCPDWFGGPDGPCPKNMHTSFLAWVIGGPALKSGGDLGSYDGSGGQRDAYLASIGTDLKLLGFDVSLINTAF